MFRRIRTLLVATGVAAASLCLPAGALAVAHSNATGLHAQHTCAPAQADQATCYAEVLETSNNQVFNGKAAGNSTPSGFGPSDLASAYNLSQQSAGGDGKTVALIDANDDPNAVSDLNTYRKQYGLPSMSTCSVSGGKVTSPNGPCFTKISQTGSTTNLPSKDAGWATEESLDMDSVSALCHGCNIVLVEANTQNKPDLGAAENEAAKLGVTSMSNSWGYPEASSQTSDDSQYFNHPGIPITASTGDSGYGTSWPATAPNVIAVGGTSLKKDSSTSRGWSESAWDGAGAGCSSVESQPSWQASRSNITSAGCSKRAISDVSADADPSTGAAVYDSTPYQGHSGWQVYGGTSLSSPLIAAVYALSGNTSGVNDASGLYKASSGSLNDVTSGNDGTCSKSSALCTAKTGWDGPTGLGTPNGTDAF